MPWKPQRPCLHPGCGALSLDGYCDKHRKQVRKEIDDRRGSSTDRGYDRRWREARLQYLAEHPMCVMCDAKGIKRGASVVDHIVPHKGDYEAFWDATNWQALCKRCHDKKTAVSDGRWK